MSKELIELLKNLGYKYDEYIKGYVKELFFDYNALNKRRGLGAIMYFDNKIEVYKGSIFHLCKNGDEIIEEEKEKLMKIIKGEL